MNCVKFLQCVPAAIALNLYYVENHMDLHTSIKSCIAVDLHWELALAAFTACTITCTAAALVSANFSL